MQLRVLTYCILLVGVVSCGSDGSSKPPSDYRVISGTTMGTYYKINSNCPLSVEAIDSILDRMNAEFSTYDETSFISSFNVGEQSGWMAASEDFVNLSKLAVKVNKKSEGHFDPTVLHSVERWGFGSKPTATRPNSQDLRDLKKTAIFEAVEFDFDKKRIRKTGPVGLDYSAIAKGYTVDRIDEYLAKLPCESYMIDIGGEVRAQGMAENGGYWRIGIQNPDDLSSLIGYLEFSGGALATSGTYLNKQDLDGEVVSHIIDPITQSPIVHNTVSVTVMAESTAIADAWATALLVEGGETGFDRAKTLGLATLFVTKSPNESLEIRTTGAMSELFHRL